MTNVQDRVIEDLGRAIDAKNIGDRATMLRRVTDLFVVTSGKLSDEQIGLFDEVMGRLVAKIETSARAALSAALAPLADAPQNVVRTLALDDTIEVAGPVLARCDRVDDGTLVESASTKSQAHLLAISRRSKLADNVTDILVGRGNREVALSAARNPGAAFSEFGYSTLVRRSCNDENLANCVWARPEIPRQHLLKLFAEASESVRTKLTQQTPSKARQIADMVARASQELQNRARDLSPTYAAAYAEVRALRAAGKLAEPRLAEFARAGKFNAAAVALSFICDLPIAMIEQALVDERPEQILLIAKAAGLSWDTVKAILRLQADTNSTQIPDFERAFATFARLKTETAQAAMQFYRLRERAARPHHS